MIANKISNLNVKTIQYVHFFWRMFLLQMND